MRKILLLTLLLPILVLGYSYDVDPSTVELVASNGYVIPRLVDGYYPSDTGVPALPRIPLNIFVPGGGSAVDVEVTSLEVEELDGVWSILPTAEPRPTSKPQDYVAEPDPAIYGSAEPYPAEPLRALGGSNAAGYGIAELDFCPFVYEPLTGKLSVITHIDFEITTEPLPYATVTPNAVTRRVAEERIERVRAMVINPDEVYHPCPIITDHAVGLSPEPILNGPDFGSTAEWVFITPSSFTSAAEPLRDWKLRKGLTTAIVTTEHIYSNYSGRDNAEKIRNFIIDAYQNWSTQYVVLGGDCDYVPERRGYVAIGGTSQDDRLIPTDLYYSDLDGSWNEDNDGYWGEEGDIPDIQPDINVSRISARGASMVTDQVDKILTYETDLPAGFAIKGLFLGAYLDSYTSGGDAKDVVANSYMPGYFQMTRLYEKFGNISSTAVVNNINAGKGAIMNHCAHSNYTLIGTGPDNMYVSDANNLTNGDKAGWFYSIGCMCGGFDRPVCFAEAIVQNADGGCIAAIMNSRYGWYYPGNPGGGTSDKLDQAYFNAIFGKDILSLGAAVSDMRSVYTGAARGNQYYRWCVYENNILGPCETPTWYDVMSALQVGHPGEYDGSNFTVTVESGGSAVSGATVCLFKDDEVHEVQTTNGSGQATFSGLNVQTNGEILITVSGDNLWPYLGSVQCNNADIAVAYFDADTTEEGVLLNWGFNDYDELAGVNILRDQTRLNEIALNPAADGSYLDRAPDGDHDYYLELVQSNGEVLRYGPLNVSFDAAGSAAVRLTEAYPNPSSGAVNLEIELPETTDCELAVYDLSGRRVATVHNGQLSAGRHVLTWNGDAAAGIYIAHLRVGDQLLTRRLALVR